MKIGILGTGMVGQTLGAKLVAKGHEVKMGGRSASSEGAVGFVAKVGSGASAGTFEEAARFGDVLFLCVKGDAALEVIALAGGDALEGKILVDVTNPLDFSRGFPPALSVNGFDSLGERVQAAAPGARVVKALNTVPATVMVEPSLVPGEHALFLCGNDAAAKSAVQELLGSAFGWQTFLDVGGIDGARGTEAILPLWTRLYGKFQSPLFNFQVRRG